MKPLKIGDLVAKIPIIQGGMGVGVSLSSLAGAVAKEGGIGVLSAAQIGYDEPDFEKDPEGANMRAMKKHIRKAGEECARRYHRHKHYGSHKAVCQLCKGSDCKRH